MADVEDDGRFSAVQLNCISLVCKRAVVTTNPVYQSIGFPIVTVRYKGRAQATPLQQVTSAEAFAPRLNPLC
jgi:hypothetical protein